MSAGTRAPAKRPAEPKRSSGGCTFAEDPHRSAPDATIIWHADLDPSTLSVAALPASSHDADAIDFAHLAPFIHAVKEPCGEERIVLTDGWRHIRLDVELGRLHAAGPVRLRYGMTGAPGLDNRITPVKRLLALWEQRHFCAMLHPPDPGARRFIDALRASDALEAGATQKEIAIALYGEHAVARGWDVSSDAARSKVRRVIREARALLAGGFRKMMR